MPKDKQLSEKDLRERVKDASQPIDWKSELALTPFSNSGLSKVQKSTEATKRTRQMAFLNAYKEKGTISEACRMAKVNHNTELNWRKNDKWYQDQFKVATLEFRDKVVSRVRDWALDGIEIPVYGKIAVPGGGTEEGQVGTRRIYSENLLMFLTKYVEPQFKEHPPVQEEDLSKRVAQSPIVRIRLELDRRAEQSDRIIDITPERTIESREPKQLPESSGLHESIEEES